MFTVKNNRILSIFLNRIVQFFIMITVLSFVTFLLMKLSPGDPVREILNVEELNTTAQQEEELREELGFDRPLFVQYGSWLIDLAQLDFGTSIISGRSVADIIFSRLPNTILLSFGGIIVCIIIAFPLGVLSAIKQNKWPDYLGRFVAILGASMPTFWLGLLLISLFSLKLGWLPVMGTGSLAHFILPSLCLGIAIAPVYIRLLRENLIKTLQSSYIQAAKARGIFRWRILFIHALKGSLSSVLMISGLSIGSLIGGVTIVEVIFSWPGMGDLIISAISQRDYPLIQGYIVIVGMFVVINNLIIDILYLYISPEVRFLEEKIS